LAEFITEGHFERHLRKLRQIYKSRRDRLVAALNANFEAPQLSGSESGLHFVWRLPAGFPPAREIQLRARQLGVGVYALMSGAAFDFDVAAPDNVLVLGYSSLGEQQIDAAVAKLKALLSD
jgi:GntR family transcriptional regulator/MocR family aminotransferase